MTVDNRSVRRDLGLFLPCFAIGIGLGLIDSTSAHIAGAVGLVIAYAAYARRTVRAHSGESGDVDELTPLTFDPSKEDPPRNIAIVAQLVVGLLMIVGGAELFVEEDRDDQLWEPGAPTPTAAPLGSCSPLESAIPGALHLMIEAIQGNRTTPIEIERKL